MIKLKWPEDRNQWEFDYDPAGILKVGDIILQGGQP